MTTYNKCKLNTVLLNLTRPLIVASALSILLSACGAGGTRQQDANANSPNTNVENTNTNNAGTETTQISIPTDKPFYLGADLSYVNEMEDCGASYQYQGEAIDPYLLFAQAGANIVRVRLWHTPAWTNYSTLADVTRTIQRAHAAGMQVLLDIHYSDTWADPEKQIIPAAWEHLYNDTDALAAEVYQYTYDTLQSLQASDSLPQMVQVGNEINREVMQLPNNNSNENNDTSEPINWARNATLINSGLRAVSDYNRNHNTVLNRVLHIAQPENALLWFDAAFAAGVTEFDTIGLSYYAQWSSYPIEQVSNAIATLRSKFSKPVVVVETAYPWTLNNFDDANNVLAENALVDGYSATPEHQKKYLFDLLSEIVDGDGSGLIYWEPAWVSTQCKTQWGTGSHWENASFFDANNNNEALPAFDIFSIIRSAQQ
ncbi:glycoside hydrolase family 53 protein [Teredinibacter waterburyi]|uniref:glycoside hydrolase family 53 protein n=1 Tax=Teredinibacter waterburyi TaxID=1500538 RepID=UPI00165F8566|nr:glycosyl hydrolase 53 family protein [Teredinibacter waterburyi]